MKRSYSTIAADLMPSSPSLLPMQMPDTPAPTITTWKSEGTSIWKYAVKEINNATQNALFLFCNSLWLRCVERVSQPLPKRPLLRLHGINFKFTFSLPILL